MANPKLSEYMPTQNGGRRRSFKIDGIEVYIEPCEDDARGLALAEFLASASDVIEGLRRQVSELSAAAPPNQARLLGPGVVRMRRKELWLMNRREEGWASFGILVGTWDELFRRYDVRVTGHGRDETSEYWTVESCTGDRT
jgi:hypothetical protein